MSYRDELPEGWVQQSDDRTGYPFWVDTKAKPPRSIWVHPYQDEQFLRDHPDIKDKLAKSGGSNQSPNDLPPPYTPRRHSYSGSSSTGPHIRDSVSHPASPRASSPAAGPSSAEPAHKRGFFGKVKDKAIGTKEEREEAKRQEELYMQRQAAERRKMIEEIRRQQRTTAPSISRGRTSAGLFGQPSGGQYYAAPFGDPYSSYGGYSSYDRYGRRRQNGFGGGFGGGGLGMPLIGGMAGGLLLGDLLGGGGFGGGGFGGGGFGGGGFDGGMGGGGFDGGMGGGGFF